MAKYSKEFKLNIVEEVIKGKAYTAIERDCGILRGTAHTWVKRFKTGKSFEDKRLLSKKIDYDEYEFLKKVSALLEKLRSK